ncbi:MAG TPA: 2OG-Fe(II) oxygenase [Bdellovibrionota bacterium]
MDTPVTSRLWDETRALRERFASASPFPHLVVDQFLDPAFARKMVEQFPSFFTGKSIDEHGRKGGKAAREDVAKLGPAYQEISQVFQSQRFLDWVSSITGIPDLIFDPAYVGGGTHENLCGQDMSLHVDFNFHPIQGWHRRLNLLIYLNEEWEESWGGAIELWENPWAPPSRNRIAKIAPLMNRMVIFPTTETSWHGFEKVNIPQEKIAGVGSRKSFALYLYSKERPAQETGAMHSTVYYERPMPETIVPEKAISKADWDEMTRLTIRRDELLKLMYSREQEQNKAILGIAQEKIRHDTHAKHWLASLAFSDLEISPVPKKENSFEVLRGACSSPVIGPGSVLHVDPRLQPSPGMWAMAAKRDRSEFRLLTIHSRVGGKYICLHQGQIEEPLLVSAESLRGILVGAENFLGEPVVLPPVWDAPSLRARAGIMLFLWVHELKDEIFGRRKSPLLWKLSGYYREAMRAFGIELPVLLPGDGVK